jgi:hypothetical protein
MYYNNYKLHNYHDYGIFFSYYYYFRFLNCALDFALHCNNVSHLTVFTTSPPVCHNCVTKLGIFSFLEIREFLEMGRFPILIRSI